MTVVRRSHSLQSIAANDIRKHMIHEKSRMIQWVLLTVVESCERYHKSNRALDPIHRKTLPKVESKSSRQLKAIRPLIQFIERPCPLSLVPGMTIEYCRRKFHVEMKPSVQSIYRPCQYLEATQSKALRKRFKMRHKSSRCCIPLNQ